jgi:phospholipase/carboxylesterase
VLLRAQVPIVPDPVPSHAGTRVLISNGQADPLVSPAETERLAALLRSTGAEVTLLWQSGGHNLTRGDLASAHTWLQKFR